MSSNKSTRKPKTRFNRSTARRVGNHLHINWKKIPFEEFYMGINVELEHGLINPHTNVTDDDPVLTGKIALAHLNENCRYYTYLKHMEELMDSIYPC